LIDVITSWISAYGYVGVFLAMLIETVFPPIPSEVILPLAGYTVFSSNVGIIDAIIVGIIAGLGSTVGATIIYLVVKKIGRYAVIKYGNTYFLTSGMNFPKFVVFTLAVSLIWSISLTFVGYIFGTTTQKWVESSYYVFNYIAIIIIVGIFAYIVYRYVKSR